MSGSKTANANLHSLGAPAACTYVTVADLTATSSPASITGGTATPCLQVMVQALGGNTTYVRVGDSAITTSRGAQLGPGQSITFGVADAKDIYIIAQTGSPQVAIAIAKEGT